MIVHTLLPFSNVDGPGNRTVIFLQGCNYQCPYCHNSQTIAYCHHCGECLTVCNDQALTFLNQHVCWDSSKCSECKLCEKICPHQSSPKTVHYNAPQLLEMIQTWAAFTQGVTFSGGEALLQLNEIEHFITLYKKKFPNKSVLIDTNGSTLLANHPTLVSLCDGFILDVKTINTTEHLEIIGAPLQPVLQNLEFLIQRKKLIEVRTVLTPLLSAQETAIEVAKKLAYTEIPYQLIPVQKHGLMADTIDTFSHNDINSIFSNAQLIHSKTYIRSLFL